MWFMRPCDKMVCPVEYIDNLESDEPYICKTVYNLNNGKILFGYCCAYDGTGFRAFNEEGISFEVSTYNKCNPIEADHLSKTLNLKIDKIFPIMFENYLKVFGRKMFGVIDFK